MSELFAAIATTNALVEIEKDEDIYLEVKEFLASEPEACKEMEEPS